MDSAESLCREAKESPAVIRNDVLHFVPDGVSEDALKDLRRFAEFLNRLHSINTP